MTAISLIKIRHLHSTYPCPIFSSLVYLRFGSPTETIVRSFSSISASVIFFFFGNSWLLFLATSSAVGSIGFVYFNTQICTIISTSNVEISLNSTMVWQLSLLFLTPAKRVNYGTVYFNPFKAQCHHMVTLWMFSAVKAQPTIFNFNSNHHQLMFIGNEMAPKDLWPDMVLMRPWLLNFWFKSPIIHLRPKEHKCCSFSWTSGL